MYIVATDDFRLVTKNFDAARKSWLFFKREGVTVEFWLDFTFEV